MNLRRLGCLGGAPPIPLSVARMGKRTPADGTIPFLGAAVGPRLERMTALAMRPLEKPAPLASHVLHVVGVSAEKEMIGIRADGIIAVVADFHPGRNRPSVQLPRYASRESVFSGAVKADPRAVLFHPPTPVPASVSHDSPTPKQLLESLRTTYIDASWHTAQYTGICSVFL